MSEAPKRLSKVAKEFNVGISTIVEFLSSKGVEVDHNPNSKIAADAYGMLRDEYMPDKAAKEKSQELKMNRVVRETITIEDQKKGDRQRTSEPEQEEILIKNVSVSPVVKKEEPKEEEPAASEKPVEETPAPAPEEAKVEEPAAPAPEEQAPAEPVAEKEEDKDGPQVVGKIDLDKLNLKSRPDSKKKKEEKVKPAEEPAPAPEKKEAEEPVAEKPADSEKSTEDKEKPEEEVIKAQVKKLDGPTVVGKIELPVNEPKKKKPVASSSEQKGEDKKKKRKRIVTPNTSRPPQQRDGRGGNNKGGGAPGGKRGRKPEKAELSEEEIQKEIKETLARLSGGGKSKASKFRREKRQAQAQQREEELAAQEADKQKLKATEFVTANELATMMNVSVTEVISACLSLGMMVSINQRLDAETLQIVAEEFGYEVEFVSTDIEEAVEEEVDDPADLSSRPPIVTVMGHVDHGKTSLLDYIREANVIAGEAGGITQHIGAYNVTVSGDREITFLDTPGHEAFTAMRARGAQVTDLVIIVIAADDSVMPQTKEAINHAQAADVPIVFAFNKIDKPGANANKIREELSQMGLLTEDWGGKFQAQEISAKSGQGVDELLEKVLLEAELLELQANPKRVAEGIVIEASLDKGRGYVATLLVQTGTLSIGDLILAGSYYGRVKAMFDERGNRVDEAGPSHPVSMLGFNGAPNAGDKFKMYEDEREAKQIATKREQLQREQGIRTTRHITLDEIGRRLAIGDFQELNVIVKGDVDGSVEALSDSLLKLSTEVIQVNVIHKSVGQITESDVLLASASDAIIVGFQVRPSPSARKLAEREEIDIRLYSVIYDAIGEVKDAMEGMLKPKTEEKIVCNIEVREVFKISKVGTVAGCYVLDGKITRNTSVRLIREGVVVYTGELGSLKRFKEDVREVNAGYECGLNINNFNDIKVGDIIEGYEEVEIKQTL